MFMMKSVRSCQYIEGSECIWNTSLKHAVGRSLIPPSWISGELFDRLLVNGLVRIGGDLTKTHQTAIMDDKIGPTMAKSRKSINAKHIFGLTPKLSKRMVGSK